MINLAETVASQAKSNKEKLPYTDIKTGMKINSVEEKETIDGKDVVAGEGPVAGSVYEHIMEITFTFNGADHSYKYINGMIVGDNSSQYFRQYLDGKQMVVAIKKDLAK